MSKPLGLITFLLLFIYSFLSLNAQISEGGIPPGFYHLTSKSILLQEEVPVDFDVDELKKEDIVEDKTGFPQRIAAIIPVNYNLNNSGQWTDLPDGRKLWQLNLKAEGAIACMLYYDEFYIPEGGQLFIYNVSENHILGAYTSRTNPAGKDFATEFVSGDNFIVEYIESVPIGSAGQINGRIQISGLAYGYNHLELYNENKLKFNSSGSCEVNVNCSEGAEWQHQKKGVAKMIVPMGGYSRACSGSLINSLSDILQPYFLTAYHCFNDIRGRKADFGKIMFYFHYEFPDCENLMVRPDSKTMTGAEYITFMPISGASDGALIRLKDDIPESYDVFYNGWDVSGAIPERGVCIHHPQEDVKKISTYDSPPVSATWDDGAENAYWNISFSATKNGHGITEDNSSGSPLFDQNKRIVGTLTGGNSTCDYPDGTNYFGKLWYHWDKVDTAKMKTFLDPLNTGELVLDGRYKDKLNIDFSIDRTIVYEEEIINFTNTSYGYTSLEWSFPGGNPALSTEEKVEVFFPEKGIYPVSLIIRNGSEERIKTIEVTVKARNGKVNPQSLNATQIDNAVYLEWKTEEEDLLKNNNVFSDLSVLDTLSWHNNQIDNYWDYKDGTTYDVLSLWYPEDMEEYDSLTIHSILFYAGTDLASDSISVNIYEDFKGVYSQNVKNITAESLNRIDLSEPFTVDLNKPLLFGYKINQKIGFLYPVAYDSGPLILGRNCIKPRNVDFLSAEYLNIQGNFLISAIISGEKKNEYTFNVYRNGELIGSGIKEKFYTDANIATDGRYCYQISIAYKDGEESHKTNECCISIDSSGVEEIPYIKLYPNPVTDHLTIINEQEIIEKIIVTDTRGNIINIFQPASKEYIMHTSIWSEGVYIIKIVSYSSIAIHKIIKIR